ncbi:MAG TPA: hypothetical protein VEQ62_07810 [Stellaceae bacterium]|jgi:hypothetical protein|nr:hypothetical protein [Stellaceae bacterium]
MFALPKLIIVVLVVAAAWVGYRWLNGVTRDLPRRRMASSRTPINAEDFVACEVCRAYVAAGAPACNRPDCPRPR